MTEFKVIGAGLPRTGTLSQKIALEMLGFNPCYHMVEVLQNTKLVATWADALEGRANWHEIFDGFGASVDWPGSYYYKELVGAYPDAKVVLSVRDGDAWAKSMKTTIWDVLYGDSLMEDVSRARGRIDPEWQGYTDLMRSMWERRGFLTSDAIDLDSGELARAMERYNQEVIDTVPADRLLVWSVAEGWGPLCAFLDVPVPEAEFPRVNDSAGFSGLMIGGCMAKLNEWLTAQDAGASAGH
ncbi:MAG TPA: sulfotransferase [Acidimicrobiales bacterium]|nr:sulfotransferase [Acidimicrobiales bacterium]